MSETSDKVACVVEFGLFVSLAELLAKDFKRVIYYKPCEGAFPTTTEKDVGEGIPGVESVLEFWPDIDEIDLFVFPDVYFGGLQNYLESIDKRVWGSRHGDSLELYRHGSKEHMKSLGMNIGKYSPVIGMDALRSHLKHHKDQYVKHSLTRGDGETFYAKNYDNIEPRLDELAHKLGPQHDHKKFTVEDKIPDAAEIASDIYCIDGQFPSIGAQGIEAKSRGYLCHVVPYDKMAPQLIEANEKLSETLAQYHYRNFFAIETRIDKDGKGWVIDPCCRFGNPPSALLQMLYSNLAEIIWHGASGELVDPVPAAEWGAQLQLSASWAADHWLQVQYPDNIADNVKLNNFTIMDGKRYIVPGLENIGAVVAVGATKDEAIDKVREYAEQVEGHTIEFAGECFSEIDEQIEKLEKIGIEF